MHRIRGRSAHPARDIALFYMLFATGAPPLEIARLELRDRLNADGSVRRESELRADATITGKSRPVFFASSKLDDALSTHLRVRSECGHGLGNPSSFRGLDPAGRLFLTATGEGFRITPYGEPGQHRFLCRPAPFRGRSSCSLDYLPVHGHHWQGCPRRRSAGACDGPSERRCGQPVCRADAPAARPP